MSSQFPLQRLDGGSLPVEHGDVDLADGGEERGGGGAGLGDLGQPVDLHARNVLKAVELGTLDDLDNPVVAAFFCRVFGGLG